eukprot:CAMPEP_0194531478 /NCGR_PEP_ID=MMETSP0253-20130528/68779_1 /TAXON_ID=2966 /ORGANISM="Noctiluca scintillans" /LENGTH=122 /DNA_ID=CAMNT_0039376833 /DNA_START=619 /DNA_END=984 /DNA_ORIENTATION=-
MASQDLAVLTWVAHESSWAPIQFETAVSLRGIGANQRIPTHTVANTLCNTHLSSFACTATANSLNHKLDIQDRRHHHTIASREPREKASDGVVDRVVAPNATSGEASEYAGVFHHPPAYAGK